MTLLAFGGKQGRLTSLVFMDVVATAAGHGGGIPKAGTGFQQSQLVAMHINAIGDGRWIGNTVYCKMLRQSVSWLKGKRRTGFLKIAPMAESTNIQLQRWVQLGRINNK